MGRVGSRWEGIVSSFWFMPGLLTVGAIILFVVSHQIDRLLSVGLEELPLIFSGGATAARSLLSTIAGSLITVVATVFSLTIVALQLASTSYTPRLLRNFTSDRGVQVVLGAYIGTFTYALLALRIIRTPESQEPTFIPVISVTLAVVLTLVCVGLLVYFIHHIAGMIQSSTIVKSAHQDATQSLANLTDLENAPAEAQDPRTHPAFKELMDEEGSEIKAQESGYVQYMDLDRILDAATQEDGAVEKAPAKMVVELPFGPGHFVAAGLPILRLWPAPEDVPEGGLGEKTEKEIHEAFFFGKERAFSQDFAFGLRQLSDIALKGVSPGVNDPTTSMQAMDRMEAIFIALGEKALPPHIQERNLNGTQVLLKVGRYDFDDVVGLAFDQLRRASFTSGQVAVLERLLEVIERALAANALPERQQALWARVFAVGRLAPGQITDPRDAMRLTQKAAEIGASLLERASLQEAKSDSKPEEKLDSKSDAQTRPAVGSDLEELVGLAADLPGGQRVREAVDGV